MMKKLFIFFTIIIIAVNTFAQECNCGKAFDWIVSTFEENDAGFQYVIDKKGKDDYIKYTALYKEKAKSITTLNDCSDVMNGWLHYFRSGHIGAGLKESGENSKKLSDAEIRLQYKNEKTIELTENQLINILEKKQNKNPIEGIWDNGVYSIGIIGDEKSNKKFTAFIIKADSVYWMPKQVKAGFTLNDDNKTFTVDYYMQDHSKQATQAKLINDSGTLLSIHKNYWTRVYPESKITKKEELLVSFNKYRLPFVEKLSDKTVYIRIPSFAPDKKKDIDSVLAKYNSLITSIPNLIIDIRNGTGGNDASYKKIIPYLYTNPIRTVGMQLYATKLNAEAYEKYAKIFNDTSDINHGNRVARKMRENIGKFITLSEQTYSLDSLDKVLPYPEKVAIICNQFNGSTDEQFLLDAKQSTKVKVFGRPTGGMLDISNINVIEFTDGNFVVGLGYCMSKSYRIPDYCIDGVGIQPDYFIDDAISEDDWIEYTKSVLEQ